MPLITLSIFIQVFIVQLDYSEMALLGFHYVFIINNHLQVLIK